MDGNVVKETFLAGLSCLTKGWYAARTKPEVTQGLQWRFYCGSDVAKRARDWLGVGQMLRRTPLPAALDSTNAAIADTESTLLFEASFCACGCFARADAIRRGVGGWDLLEIKSGMSKDDGTVKEEYIDDLTFTAWVALSAGFRWSGAKLILINRDYRRDGSVPMFIEIDATPAVRTRMADFNTFAPSIVAAAIQDDRPTPALQFVCKDCDHFANDCIGAGVSDTLFIIPRLLEKKFNELRTNERIGNIPASVKMSDTQQKIVDLIRSGKPIADLNGLQLLDGIKHPIYYLDFETVSPHLPWFNERPPYDTTPFQYSLHVRDNLTKPAEHRFYLAPSTGDWRREITLHLLDALGSTGSIVVYSSFERTRLKALIGLFSDLSSRIEAVIERLFDLEEVVRKGYAHPGFSGRTSIKKVLPIVAPHLTYDGLAVKDGDDASGAFGLMRVGEIPEERHATLRVALEEYCHRDTQAMVEIHDFLRRERSDLM